MLTGPCKDIYQVHVDRTMQVHLPGSCWQDHARTSTRFMLTGPCKDIYQVHVDRPMQGHLGNLRVKFVYQSDRVKQVNVTGACVCVCLACVRVVCLVVFNITLVVDIHRVLTITLLHDTSHAKRYAMTVLSVVYVFVSLSVCLSVCIALADFQTVAKHIKPFSPAPSW